MSGSRHPFLIGVAVSALLSFPPGVARAQEAAEPVPEAPSVISLEPGEISSVAVDELERIAVGDPTIADLTIVSSAEVLVQAKKAGKTNVIVWDRQGRHVWWVEVVSRVPQAAETQLRELLARLTLPSVSVHRENNKLFLTGEVPNQEEMDRVEQMLPAFPGAVNLLRVAPTPPASAAPPPPLVKLGVQVIEISRTDLEKLGVKWSESMAFTNPEVTDLTTSRLFRFGTSLTQSSVSTTLDALVRKNRARVLSEPTLVTASGKQASSFIGLEIPIMTASSFSTTTSAVGTSIEFRKTGVLLKMTPTVHPGEQPRKITTVIEAEISDKDDSVALNVPVGSQTVSVPGFKVRKTETEVTMVSGETIVIAGLLESQDTRNVDQVPALGSMPLVGRLFRSPKDESTGREIVIAVTPKLLAESVAQEEAVVDAEPLAQPGPVPSEGTAQTTVQVLPPTAPPTLRYAMQVQDRIAQSLRYPEREGAGGLAGQVKLRLHLFQDGTVAGAMVVESSGIEAFDQEALRAAESQSPYPPFPPELAQPDLWLELPVHFRP
ncbi:MAG: TonB family protein [Candidatus Omnitrophota bacterium]|nr:TonB family protein [Candidatus Omnitrophota bacterium]